MTVDRLLAKIRSAIPYVLFVALFAGMAWVMDEDVELIDQWPDELRSARSGFCTVKTYRSCESGDWFGIYEDQTPSLNAYENNGRNIMGIMCLRWETEAGSFYMRIIETRGRTLLLCRMKDPAEIDRGEVLERMEQMR
ncbi:MAG: hypothetical protein FKY71_07750 [Spiribacter salinus]|uniref:Uncharacterized protein n=1 Tax=Spiribacter salinus TaxID=1335746 RepID=A0A540VTZ0_9GAMM|nr:MAG: hypothetical protein FKY71_07750 [Spiribacter salinus]